MNKKIKKIIALALTISAFSTVSPISSFMTTKAYASSSDTKLHSLYLSDGSINFDKDDTSYDVRVSSSVDEIRITARPENEDSTVTIDGDTVDSSDDYKKAVSLDKGDNTIKIKVEDESNNTKTYTLHIRRGSSSSSDDVYLSDIRLSDGSIDFNQDDTSYNVRVSSDVNEIRITAEPENSDDTVRIDGTSVDDGDNWRRTVSLSKGENTIDVVVQDDNDDERTYTLHITRGYSSDSQSDSYLDELSISGNSINLSNDKTTYDVYTKDSVDEIDVKAITDDSEDDAFVNGTRVTSTDDYEKTVSLDKGQNTITVKVKDKYGNERRTYTLNVIRGDASTTSNQNSSSVSQMKNSWYTDRATSKTYYYDENGNKATGWKYINYNWYLFDSNGVMLKGWQQVGWNWYYMYDSGVMASSTVIDGYRVGADGAWVR